MAERYCPYCGAHNEAVAETCASCLRPLPGTEGHRHEPSGKRKTAMLAIVLGLVMAVFGYLSEGGPRIINSRRGPSTEGSVRLQLILVGAGLAGYGAFSLYRLRDER